MLNNILEKIGNTPMLTFHISSIPYLNVHAKLEYYNPTGSVKDRAASYVITKGLNDKIINKQTTIIESSSGNFGVALAAYAKLHGLKFICVIDQNTSPANEMLIRLHGAELIKITEPDEHGGYLLNRIRKIKSIMDGTENIYWVNQYQNPLNAEAYYHTLGEEMCKEIPDKRIDYVFMGVSSGGTITGVSRKVKSRFPKAKIIAVDIYGSVVFGKAPRKRYIPGIGSSMRPPILESAMIDDVVWVSEVDTTICCRELLQEHNVHAGGSAGSVYAAIKKYFSMRKSSKPLNVACVFADQGSRYSTTIYDDNWFEELKAKSIVQEEYDFA